jgi:hypothetical protein
MDDRAVLSHLNSQGSSRFCVRLKSLLTPDKYDTSLPVAKNSVYEIETKMSGPPRKKKKNAELLYVQTKKC